MEWEKHYGGYDILQALSPTVLMQRVLAVPEDDEQQLCVIEVLAEPHASLESVLAFREIMAQEARLKHDAIIPVREVGQWEGEPYLATLYRSGTTLSKILVARKAEGQGGLPPAIAATIINELADALRHAHSLNLTHGAVRGDMVVIDLSGDVSMTGFTEGALITRLRPELSDPKDFAPELRRSQEVTEACDCYGIGALFYRMLTGHEQPDEWEPRWSGMMMELSTAGIPGECLHRTQQFLHRTLAERASQRYPTMDALVKGFRPLLEELGGPKSSTLIADVGRPFIPRPPHTRPVSTQPVALRPPSSPSMVSVPSRHTEDSGKRSRPASTRTLHHHTPSVRSLSPELRSRVGFHPLEILARSRYQVLDEIGSGGTGTVYKVLDTTLNEIVALKVLRSELVSDAAWLQRFKRELKITRDLDHPNILPAYHLEHLDGLYFFTMRYIDGETLYERVGRHGAMTLEEGVRLLDLVGRALGAAHTQGIVHRDFKSANILIENVTGSPFLMDFGIAYAPDAQSLTATGQGIGTPMYMAPEQAMGKNLSPAADVYSFGVVLYEVFCGQLPFEPGTTVAVYTAQVNADYRPMLEVKPNLSERLAALIDDCLRPKAEERPKTMRVVLKRLVALLDQED